MNKIEVYLEIGKKKTFAGALDWPGWGRSGRDEASALQALLDYGPRYTAILPKSLKFKPPSEVSDFKVVERLEGNATTDFGAPDIAPSVDQKPIDEAELQRFQTLMKAYWKALKGAMQQAAGKELRKGPRGGGRELEGVVEHILGAQASYLGRLAWKFKKSETEDLNEEVARTEQAVLEGLAAAARGETPKQGPRGGVLWPPRYFVRRSAWHVLDHVWEIEDRTM